MRKELKVGDKVRYYLLPVLTGEITEIEGDMIWIGDTWVYRKNVIARIVKKKSVMVTREKLTKAMIGIGCAPGSVGYDKVFQALGLWEK